MTWALVAAALVGGALWWRVAVRHHSLPCPTWLAWLLENPYVEAVAGSTSIIARAGVARGMWVLDAGCGPGRVTLAAAKQVGPVGEVVAIDVQEGMLRRLRDRAKRWGLENIRTVHGGIGYTMNFEKPTRT